MRLNNYSCKLLKFTVSKDFVNVLKSSCMLSEKENSNDYYKVDYHKVEEYQQYQYHIQVYSKSTDILQHVTLNCDTTYTHHTRTSTYILCLFL